MKQIARILSKYAVLKMFSVQFETCAWVELSSLFCILNCKHGTRIEWQESERKIIIDSRQYGMDSRFAIYLRGRMQSLLINLFTVQLFMYLSCIENLFFFLLFFFYLPNFSQRKTNFENWMSVRAKRTEVHKFTWINRLDKTEKNEKWKKKTRKAQNICTICNYYFDHLT